MNTQLFRMLLGIGIAVYSLHVWSQAVYTAPDSLGRLWQEVYEGSAFPCESKQPPMLSEALYRTTSSAWVLIIETPNYLCNTHHISVVSVSAEGHWQLLNEWAGKFSNLIPVNEGFIVLSHWEIEGAYPQLIWSPDSETFHGIPLPEDRYDECCIELIDSAFVNDDRLFVLFYQDEENAEETWSLPLNALQPLGDSETDAEQRKIQDTFGGLWKREISPSSILDHPTISPTVTVKKTDSPGSYLLTYTGNPIEETITISLPILSAPPHD